MRELPRLDYGSDWTTGTVVLVFRGLASSAMQIARYLTILSAAKIFGVAASLIATQGGEITTRAPLDAQNADCGHGLEKNSQISNIPGTLSSF